MTLVRAGMRSSELKRRTKVAGRATAESRQVHSALREVPNMHIPARTITTFRSTVWKYWKTNGRHTLSWRQTRDPYKILVSEIMLQQTQVDRVTPFYKKFLKKFPTIEELARSNLANVFKIWSGLGYNRRAKMLHDCAKEIIEKYSGAVPRDRAALESLPGIGPYTAGAIRAFAWNEPDVFVETNIRTAFLQHFAKLWMSYIDISDRDINTVAQKAAEGQDPREWHSALMDYGAYLKKRGIKLNHKSAHYTKQSKFEGSLRQIRGAILHQLQKKSQSEKTLRSNLHLKYIEVRHPYIEKALAGLERDGLITTRNGKWQIS